MNKFNLPEATVRLMERLHMVLLALLSEVPINCSNNTQEPISIFHRLNIRIILLERLVNDIVDTTIVTIAIKVPSFQRVLRRLSTKLRQFPSKCDQYSSSA